MACLAGAALRAGVGCGWAAGARTARACIARQALRARELRVRAFRVQALHPWACPCVPDGCLTNVSLPYKHNHGICEPDIPVPQHCGLLPAMRASARSAGLGSHRRWGAAAWLPALRRLRRREQRHRQAHVYPESSILKPEANSGRLGLPLLQEKPSNTRETLNNSVSTPSIIQPKHKPP